MSRRTLAAVLDDVADFRRKPAAPPSRGNLENEIRVLARRVDELTRAVERAFIVFKLAPQTGVSIPAAYVDVTGWTLAQGAPDVFTTNASGGEVEANFSLTTRVFAYLDLDLSTSEDLVGQVAWTGMGAPQFEVRVEGFGQDNVFLFGETDLGLGEKIKIQLRSLTTPTTVDIRGGFAIVDFAPKI